MNIALQKIKLDILAWCNEDFTSLFWIESFVGQKNLEKETIKNNTLKMIKILLDEELIKAGDLL